MAEPAAASLLAGPAAASQPLFLASASTARADLLKRAGVPFTQEPAGFDEEPVKLSLKAEGASAARAAEALAEGKARMVSAKHHGALVVGADQILDCAGAWFDKPADTAEAKAHLRALRGRRHRLVSAACVVADGEHIWHRTASAELVMRAFSDDFLDAYVAAAGERVLSSVGAYRLEGLGAQLFAAVEGDYFTILGLPLLPLLEFLRGRGVVQA